MQSTIYAEGLADSYSWDALCKWHSLLHSQGLQDTLSAAKNIAPVHPLSLGIPFKDDRAGTGGAAGVDLSRRVSPPQQSLSDGALCTVMGRRLSRVSIGAERYPETVEALVEVGGLRDKHESLEARVGRLEANKADQTQFQHLRDLLNAMGTTQTYALYLFYSIITLTTVMIHYNDTL